MDTWNELMFICMQKEHERKKEPKLIFFSLFHSFFFTQNATIEIIPLFLFFASEGVGESMQ